MYVTSHARHAMRMGCREASRRPGGPPHLTGREGRRGGEGGGGGERGGERRDGAGEAAGRYEGEEAIFSKKKKKEPTEPKMGKRKSVLFFFVLTVKSSNSHLMNVMFCRFLQVEVNNQQQWEKKMCLT